MDSEFPQDDEPESQDGPADDDARPPSFTDFVIKRSEQLDDLLSPHSEFDPVREMFDRFKKGAGESIRLPHESDEHASPPEIEWPIAPSDDPPGGIQQLPYLIPEQPGDGSSRNVVKKLTADDLQLAVSANDQPSKPADDAIGADPQPYFHPPQPDGGAMFSPGSFSGGVSVPDEISSGDDGPPVDDRLENESDSTTDARHESESDASPPDSSDLSERAHGFLGNTADGGPPLARPIVLISPTTSATQRLIEESLSAASQRDSQTLESIAKARVHDAFWIRDAQRRAVTGDW